MCVCLSASLSCLWSLVSVHGSVILSFCHSVVLSPCLCLPFSVSLSLPLWPSASLALCARHCCLTPADCVLLASQPLLVQRNDPTYYNSIFTIAQFKELLFKGGLTFEQDLDITSYKAGKRTTLNGTGAPDAAKTWSHFRDDGCSLRLLCPQAHSPRIAAMLAQLESYFGMFTGSNMYLTPAGTQGFSPHYDDIEAFVLQLEGKKHWRWVVVGVSMRVCGLWACTVTCAGVAVGVVGVVVVSQCVRAAMCRRNPAAVFVPQLLPRRNRGTHFGDGVEPGRPAVLPPWIHPPGRQRAGRRLVAHHRQHGAAQHVV